MFQMGTVASWRVPAFFVGHTKTPDGLCSYRKHLVLILQVTQDESESLKTSVVLNERDPESKLYIIGSPAYYF